MSFVPENPLEKSLFLAATEISARPQFCRDLLDAPVYIVPVGNLPQTVDGTILPGQSLQLDTLESRGIRFTPFFSSVKRVHESIEQEATYLQMKGRDFLEMTRGSHLVLNPGLAYGKEFLPDEVGGILDGSIFGPSETHVVQEPTQVLIGQPAQYPHQMVEGLKKFFASRPTVKKAYLAHYVNPSRGSDPGLLICVEIDNGSTWHEAIDGVGLVIEGAHPNHKFIDFIQYDSSSLVNYFRNGQPPFYQRLSF